MPRLFVPLLMMLLPALPAAATLELLPVQDAYICDCQPDVTNPNGGEDYLYHGQYGSCYDRSLIEWDLSLVPDGATLISATMMLYCEAFYGTGSGQPVYHMIDDPWNELTVTFNTQPGYSADPCITDQWPEAGTWHQVDVTEFVLQWLEGTHENHGIYCFCSGTAGTCVPGFWSKDYSEEELRPYLQVEYSPEDLQQVTWAGIKDS